jgi:glycosyltransferase involved in cell wall biosynthesis
MVRGDSNLLDARPLHVRIAKRLILGRWIPRFSAYLTVGKLNEDYYRFYGADESRFFPARHFVDNDFFAAQTEALQGQRAEIRSKWRIPQDAFCALFCGKFIPKKRPMDLIEAARLLSTSIFHLPSPSSMRPAIHLLFVGSGELGAQLRAACNVVFDAEAGRAAISERADVTIQRFNGSTFSESSSPRPSTLDPRPSASFAGFLNQTEIAKAYIAADVLVLPSGRGETWGLVVNEAMACGLPAIVSDKVGCAPDLINEGKTGFSFPAGAPAQLARQVVAVLEMKKCGHDFRLALTEKMRDYSLVSAVGGTLRAIRTLAAGHSG